jgi:Flp pilus assembly protein TadG
VGPGNKVITMLKTIRTARFGALTRKLKGLRRDQSGMAAIEMALVFPVMLTIYFGLVDVTNLLSANRRVTLAASTLADLVTQAPGVITKADLTGFYNAVKPIMDPFPSSSVGIQIFSYRKNGTAVTLRWQDTKNGSCGALPATTGLINLMTEGNDLVIARACVSITPITGKIVGSAPYNLVDTLVLRPRQSKTIDCNDCT